MNKLKYMKTFMYIVEAGSIVGAAKKLGLTKAAVSKQLIDLEERLNIQLVKRTTRALKLTYIGELYFIAVKKVFNAVVDAETIVSQIHDRPVGTLKILSHRHFGEKYIVENLHEIVTLYPDLKLDLELADRFPDLEKENIDIVCGVGHEGPDHLVRKKISSAVPVLCASPDYLAQFGKPKNPEDLKQHRYITHSFREPDNRLIFDDKEIYLDYHIRLNDAQAMLKCALQGAGFIKIYNYFVTPYLQSGKLVEILQEYRETQQSIYLFYQPRKFMPAKMRVFIDFLNQKVREEERLMKILKPFPFLEKNQQRNSTKQN